MQITGMIQHTLLNLYLSDENSQLACQLVSRKSFLLDFQNGSAGNFTPLTLAADEGNLNLVQTLVAVGANIDMPTGDTRQSALNLCCQNNHFQVAKYLISRGADLN